MASRNHHVSRLEEAAMALFDIERARHMAKWENLAAPVKVRGQNRGHEFPFLRTAPCRCLDVVFGIIEARKPGPVAILSHINERPRPTAIHVVEFLDDLSSHI